MAPLAGDPNRFAGKQLDAETALHYFDARYYRQTWGRFTSVDPLHVGAAMTDPQQWNRYAYARNNPLKFGDPSGLQTACLHGPQSMGCVDAIDVHGDGRWNDTITGWAGGSAWGTGMSCGGPPPSDAGYVPQIHEGNCYGWEYVGLELPSYDTGNTGGPCIDCSNKPPPPPDCTAGCDNPQLPFVVANPVIVNWVIRLQRMASLLTNWLRATPAPPINANDLHHIFGQAKHGLDSVVRAAGSQQRAYEIIWRGTQQAVQGRPDGHFGRVQVEALGHIVTVEGAVVNGVARIGSAWIP